MASRIDSTVVGVDRVWQVLDTQVDDGRMPGLRRGPARPGPGARAGGRLDRRRAAERTHARRHAVPHRVGHQADRRRAHPDPDPRRRAHPRRPDRPVAARGRGAAGARLPRRPARPHRARAASRHRPRPADRHLGLGRRHGRRPAAVGDDRARRLRRPAAPRRLPRRVRRAGHEPAARLPAGRGLALRDRHRPARDAADAGHRTHAGRPVRRTDHGPAADGVDRVPGRPGAVGRCLPTGGGRARSARPAGRHVRRPPAVRGAELGAGVDRPGRPAVLLRDGRRRRARAHRGRGRADDGGRAHPRAAAVRAVLPRPRRVVGPGHRAGRRGGGSRGRRPAAGAGRAAPGRPPTSTRCAGRSPCS